MQSRLIARVSAGNTVRGLNVGDGLNLQSRGRAIEFQLLHQVFKEKIGGDPGRARTCNLRSRIPTLYPLSHGTVALCHAVEDRLISIQDRAELRFSVNDCTILKAAK
jgi:hypothetical protein